ncbi:MAG: Asp-tRNA(Asn)/Glu-tRNA(Gln) amidotransferase GatCAB subunit B, partial [Chitinophagaceae bacterium]
RLLPVMMEQPDAAPMELAQALNLLQESDEGQVQQWIDEVINSMPDKVKEFKAGKKNLLGLFAGQVKKISGGKADMQLVQKILTQQLNK